MKRSIFNIRLLSKNYIQIQQLKNEPYLPYCDIISLSFDEISFLDFRLSNKEMLDMFSVGYSIIKEYLF